MTNPAYEATNSDVEKLIKYARINAECGEHASPEETLKLVTALQREVDIRAQNLSIKLHMAARISELEALTNGMMQLSNELAAKSVVIGELGFLENLERIISERDRDIDIGQLGHENYQALMVAALDAFRAAPLTAKQPTPATTFDAAAAIRSCMDEFPLAVQDIVEECAVIAENTIRAAGATI